MPVRSSSPLFGGRINNKGLSARMPGLGERVTDELRRMIISGEIPIETHLVESQLSEFFDLSRGPIRDALRHLESEGLVESRRRGVFVLGLTAPDIAELYELREALELKVMTLCSERGVANVEEVTQSLERMRTAAAAGDNDAFTNADLDFHSAFYVAAGNRRILDVWSQYRPSYEMMMDVATMEPVDLGPIYENHKSLFELTSSGDMEKVQSLLNEHLMASKQRLLAAYIRLNAASTND